MSLRITIHRVVQPNLRTDTWNFDAFTEDNATRSGVILMLVSYQVDERPSRRHKMRKRIVWESYRNSMAHNSPKPTVPPDVIEEARTKLTNNIIVEV